MCPSQNEQFHWRAFHWRSKYFDRIMEWKFHCRGTSIFNVTIPMEWKFHWIDCVEFPFSIGVVTLLVEWMEIPRNPFNGNSIPSIPFLGHIKNGNSTWIFHFQCNHLYPLALFEFFPFHPFHASGFNVTVPFTLFKEPFFWIWNS